MIKRSASYIALLFLAVFAVYSCGTNSTPAGSTVSTAASQVTNPNPNNFNPKGTVSGVVADFTTQKPIAGATVYITDKSAITGAQGQFTITGVAANRAVGNEPANVTVNDPYIVTVDMTAVNNAIAAGQPKYPAIVYNAVTVKYDSLGDAATFGTNATNHDTPVDGFVASMTVNVGKLDANIIVQAVNILTNAPVTGAAAELISTGSNNSTTGSNLGGAATNGGAIGHVVATGTTSAAAAGTVPAGAVVFSNVEAGRVFNVRFTTSTLRGESGDANNAAAVIQAQSDGVTSTYTLDGVKNNPIFMSASDVVAPIIASTVPANLADIAAGTTTVEFRFSEAIKMNNYALAITNGMAQNAGGGVYTGVTVNSLGMKAGNTAYTLAWAQTNVPNDTLTVTFATDPSTKYSVSIAGALGAGKLLDAANNVALANGLSTVTFTTNNGNIIPTAPTVLLKDPVQGNNTIYWTTVANALKYRVYIDVLKANPGVNNNWVGQGYMLLVNCGNGLPLDVSVTMLNLDNNCVLQNGAPVNYGVLGFANGITNKVRYTVQVVAVSTDLIEGPPASITISDTLKPKITSLNGFGGWTTAVPAIDGWPNFAGSTILNTWGYPDFTLVNQTHKFAVQITFDETMDPASVMPTANWSITRAGYNGTTPILLWDVPNAPASLIGYTLAGTVTDDVLPVLNNVYYDPNTNTAYLVLTYTISPLTAATDTQHVEFRAGPNVVDINGNALDPKFNQTYTGGVAGGVVY